MTSELEKRARALGLHGLLVRWPEVGDLPWVAELIAVEEAERYRRSQERRLSAAKIGRFKPIADFDWSWPSEVDRALIEELLTLEFARKGTNAVLVGVAGPSGAKTTLAISNALRPAFTLAVHRVPPRRHLPRLSSQMRGAEAGGP